MRDKWRERFSRICGSLHRLERTAKHGHQTGEEVGCLGGGFWVRSSSRTPDPAPSSLSRLQGVWKRTIPLITSLPARTCFCSARDSGRKKYFLPLADIEIHSPPSFWNKYWIYPLLSTRKLSKQKGTLWLRRQGGKPFCMFHMAENWDVHVKNDFFPFCRGILLESDVESNFLRRGEG